MYHRHHNHHHPPPPPPPHHHHHDHEAAPNSPETRSERGQHDQLASLWLWFPQEKSLDHPDHQYGLMENMELYALYMQCIAYPTYIYIYIPLICQLHTIYKLKIYINHLRFYVIFHNCLPLTLMWPRQIHTHIYTYIQYIYIDNGYSYLHIFHLNHLSIRNIS